MRETPLSERLHIGIFGKRNTGKSSLINALTGQRLAIVSNVAGTTTDPVHKTMEILPIGPCVIIDTAGIDDTGVLAKERIEKTYKVLRKIDVGIIVIEPNQKITSFEMELVDLFKKRALPFVLVINKIDTEKKVIVPQQILENKFEFVEVSSKTLEGINDLKLKLIQISPISSTSIPLLRDILKPGDNVVMVCPIDSAMPKGRLILPQVQVLREILDADALAHVCKDKEFPYMLDSLKKKPDLVITDSQVFEKIKDIVPSDVDFTSFSIIYARYKGELDVFVEGVKVLEQLQDKDKILIAEACTHHVQPEDIGRVKLPKWIKEYTKKEIIFDVTAGGDFPEDISQYKLIISCGGCMINRKEMLYRIEKAKKQGILISNYGVVIAYLSGILKRTVLPFQNK